MPFARSISLRSASLLLRVAKLGAQRAILLEARDGHVEDRLQAIRLHARDDVGGDAGLERGLDRRVVAVFREQHDRPWLPRVDERELLERVARRRVAVDDDDVGLQRGDAIEQRRMPDIETSTTS